MGQYFWLERGEQKTVVTHTNHFEIAFKNNFRHVREIDTLLSHCLISLKDRSCARVASVGLDDFVWILLYV